MINGVKLSEIDLINKNRNQHLKRLEKIHGSKSKKYEQSDNFIKMLKTRRDNHVQVWIIPRKSGRHSPSMVTLHHKVE